MRLAQVAPVAGQRVHDGVAALDQPGQEVVPEVAEPAVALRGAGRPLAVQLLEDLDQHLRVVDEDLRRHGRGGRLVGLVGEPGDPPVPSASTVAWSPASSIGTCVVTTVHSASWRRCVLDGVGVVEAVDVVGAQHHHHLGVGGPDLVADPEQLVGVALREPVLLLGAGALLGHQQPEAAGVAVEVPRPPVGDRLLDARALELQGQPDLGDPAVRRFDSGKSTSW